MVRLSLLRKISGHRFCEDKNLQAADFTIDEIKVLLTMPDQQVYEAFDRKIATQAQKLERIKEIQQSYLTEVNTMKKMINSFCDHLLERANEPEMLREFGTNTDDAEKLVEAVRNLMLSHTAKSGEDPRTVNVTVDDEVFEGSESVEKMTFMIREEDMNDTGSKHGKAGTNRRCRHRSPRRYGIPEIHPRRQRK